MSAKNSHQAEADRTRTDSTEYRSLASENSGARPAPSLCKLTAERKIAKYKTLPARLASLAAAALLLAFAGLPAAHAGPIVSEIKVAYGDLNLESAEDARVLLARLERAARRACGGHPLFDPYYDVASQEIERRFEACYAAALGQAVAEVDAPQLARAYAELRGARHGASAGR